MKKSFISIFGVLALFAACTKESENSGIIVPEGQELVKITAIAENSRTTVDIDGACANYAWNFGDTLAVIEEDATEPAKFSLSDAAAGTFVGVKTEGKSLMFAVTPASRMASGIDVEGQLQEFTVSLPDFYDEYIPGTTNAVMFGTPAEVQENEYKFNFSHAAALIKVTYENVPKGTAGFCLATDKVITGSWIFDSLNDVVLTTTPNGSQSVYLMLEEPVNLPNQTLDFYVPVPVGEYNSLRIMLIDENLDEVPGTVRSKQASFSLSRGDLFTTPVVTLPEQSLAGSYIIVSKPSTTGYWAAIQTTTGGNNNDYWIATESEIPYSMDVNLLDSSIDFAQFSNSDYRFEVEALETGGYVLRNARTGNYIQYKGSGNAGKEVSEDEKTAFDVFKVNADGSWTIGTVTESDTYSLKYNSSANPKRLTFYKSTSNQAGIYLIPYVGAAAPVQLSGTCRNNVVTLTAIPAEAEIRYTLDGSEPDAQSTLYEEPFAITEDVTVKAIALAPDSNYADSDVFELACTYVEPGSTSYYVKVTEGPVTAGQYLIVYEGGQSPVAFDGSLETLDAARNTIEVEISDNGIIRTAETSASEFTINTTTGTLCSASGHYIGVSSNSNGLKQTDEASTYTHNFSIDESGNAVIAADFSGSTMTLRYNKASDNLRFRYYKSGQQPVALYKLEDNREPLATPTGLSVEDMTLSWNAVTDAESYNVTIGTTVASVEETSYTFEGEPGYYNVSVVAVPADGSDYGVSAPAVLENAKFGDPKLATPVLTAGACTMDSVSATWDAIDNATEGYTVYIYVKGAQEPLYGGWTVTDCEANFTQLESGTEYTIAVYANEVVTPDRVYLASDVATIDVATSANASTISDAIAGCDAGKSFTIEGVTVLVTPTTENAIIGDDSGCMLLYKKGGHGLSVGDVITIAGATARYGNVPEFIPESIYTTASGTEVSHGDPVSLTSDMLENWKSNNFNVTYVRASGSKSGRSVTIGTNVLYLNPASDIANGMVTVSGYVYGWASKYSNFNFATVTIEEDTTAPTLSVTPKVKNWAYNDTSEQEFTIEYTNGTLSITPDTIDWADINYTPTGSGISVKPKNENTTQTRREETLTVTVTPNSSNYEAISIEISLSQGINSGSSAPDPETITFAQLGLENGVQYSSPFDGGHFTITFGGGGNDGKYYTTGTGIRTYGDGTITVASDYSIAKIEFTWDGSNAPTTDVATPSGYSTSTKAWTGSAKSIVLKRPSGSGHWRLQSVKVTYED